MERRRASRQLNPGSRCRTIAIAPVYRSDGSGTNFLFTTYLSSVSPKFKKKSVPNASVRVANGLGAKGNEGVASMTARTAGAIGYVEYAYAKQNNLTYAKMKNHDGKVVSPEIKAFQAAAANADWAKAPGYYLDSRRPAGRRELADHRRELHSDAQGSRRTAATR